VVKPASTGYMPWTPGFVGTRGSGFLDPKQPANEIRYRLDEWGKIPPEKRDAWQTLVLSDPTGTVTENNKCRIAILDTANEGVMSKLQRTPLPTEVAKGADLAKLRDQAFINIIIGQQPLSDWDKFVDQWKKGGGDDWTNEVNEWWATQGK